MKLTMLGTGNPVHPDSRNSGYEYGIDIYRDRRFDVDDYFVT